jgi:hypothetical protein
MLATAALALAPAPGMADVSISGLFSQRFQANAGSSDNDSNGDPEFRSVTDLGVVVSARTQTTQLTFAPGVRATASTSDDFLGSDTVNFRFNGGLITRGPRHSVSANVSFVPEFVSDAEAIDASTLRERDVLALTLNANAALAYQADALNSFSTSVFVRNREYSETTNDLSPSTSFGGAVGWSRALDPTTDGSLNLSYSRFLPRDSDEVESESWSLSAGLARALSPSLSMDASLGLSVTNRLETPPGDADDDVSIGVVGGFSVDYDLPDTRVSAGVSQDIDQDSTTGGAEGRTAVFASISHSINDWSSIGASTRFSLSTPVFGDTENETRRFQFSPFYNVSLTDRWDLRLGYSFRAEDDDAGSEIDNAIFVQISRGLSFLP